MFSWLPRWHPFVWLFVIIMIVAIWNAPALWGHRAGSLIGLIPELADRLTVFFQSI